MKTNKLITLTLITLILLGIGSGQSQAQSTQKKVSGVTFNLVNGKAVKLSDHAGEILILHFFSVNDNNYKKTLQDLMYVQSHNSTNLVTVLAVAMDTQTQKEITTIYNSLKMNYTTVVSNKTAIAALGGVAKTPYTIVVNRSGYIVKASSGVKTVVNYLQFIDDAK